MDRYEITDLKTLTAADHAGRIHTYLEQQGFTVQGVSIGWVEDQPIVWVTCDRDPTKTLQQYTPTLTTEEAERAEHIADAQQVLASIAAKSREARTATEKVLLGLAALQEPVTTPSTEPEPIDDDRTTGRT